MPSRSKFITLLIVPVMLALGANTQISTDRPIINFRLPSFTPEGNRSWLVRGSEARYASAEQVDITGLNLSIFTGLPDGQIETLILSSSAHVRPGELQVSGHEAIRVINDRFEATGSDWNYSHREKKVSIGKNVHVILHTELKAMLQ